MEEMLSRTYQVWLTGVAGTAPEADVEVAWLPEAVVLAAPALVAAAVAGSVDDDATATPSGRSLAFAQYDAYQL